MGVSPQKGFLGSILNLATLTKEPASNLKNSGTIAAHNLCEGLFVGLQGKLSQFKI
jgi:hypothetical protein